MSIKGFVFAAATFAIIGVATLAPHVNAADTRTEITLSPAKYTLSYELSASSEYKESFKLLNSGDRKATIKLEATPYSVQNSDYVPDYKKSESYNQLSRWIGFDHSEYTLDPGETMEVPYTITTPASIPDGDQYSMLMATIVDDDTAKVGNQVRSESRVGIKLLAHTDGKNDENVSVDIPNISPMIVGGDHRFDINFHNDGNMDYQAKYTVKVTTVLGKKEILNKTKTVQVLPTTTRSVTVPWVIMQNIGLYKVEVTASTTSGDVSVSRTTLGITPLGILALVVLIGLVISLLVKIFLRRRSRKTRFRK